MKLYYPAIFTPYNDSFTVEFPDLPGCVTQGDSLEDAFEMAEDAAAGWISTSIENGESIPKSSPIGDIVVENGFTSYVSLVV